jgi:hypothetical protein
MSALSVVGGGYGCGALAPGRDEAGSSPSGCASVQVVGTASLELLTTTWTLSPSTADQPTACPLVDEGSTRLALPENWLSARVAAFTPAEDATTCLTYSWVVVVGNCSADAPEKRPENVWVGRFEGLRRSKLCHQGGFWCPAVENSLRVKDGSLADIRVSVLDGPAIGIGCLGEVWVAKVAPGQGAGMLDSPIWKLELVEPPNGVQSLGTLICSANIGYSGRNDSLLCVAAIKDDKGCMCKALLSASADSLICRVVGRLNAPNVLDDSLVCDGAYDMWSKEVVIAWSNGLVSWVNVRSAKCSHSVALPESAGFPLLVRLGLTDSDVMITCTAKDGLTKSGALQAWALRGTEDNETRSGSIGLCFQGEVWKGVLGSFDFVLGVLRDHASREERRIKGCLIAVRTDLVTGDEDQKKSYVLEGLPWDSADGSVASAPFTKIQQRLNFRLQAGLRSLAEANVVALENQNIVFHLRRLLSQISKGGAGPRAQELFRTPLDVALEESSGRKRSKNVNETYGVDTRRLDGRDAGLAIQATPRRNDELLRVRNLEHFLDHSGLFLVVALNATLIGVKRGADHGESVASSNEAEAVWIEVQISTIVDVPWESNEVIRESEDHVVSLISRGSLCHLVSSCAVGLSELRADIRAVSQDGRGQALGSFLISPQVLSGRGPERRRIPEWCALECRKFNQSAVVISHGSNISVIKDCERSCSRKRGGVRVRVNAGESTAVLQVEAPDGLALATAAAEIVSCVPDNVRFRLAPVADPRVHTLDASWHSLTDELTATRDFARQRGPLKEPLISLLEHQIITDEAVGRMTESYVGVL